MVSTVLRVKPLMVDQQINSTDVILSYSYGRDAIILYYYISTYLYRVSLCRHYKIYYNKNE